MDAWQPICLYCHDVIRADEPVVVLEHEAERETPLGREPDLAESPRALLIDSRWLLNGWREARLTMAS